MKSITSTPSPTGLASSSNNNNSLVTPPPPPPTNPALTELRTFRTTAAQISKDVSTTSSLLAELTRLVQQQHTLFDDVASDTQADALVLRIKTNVESLNGRLDEASIVLERSKRRLGRNSQAGMEATNLVDSLKEEFCKTTSGFKMVLERRSDGMRYARDRKRRVFDSGGRENEEEGGGGRRTEMMSLMNKPEVYGRPSSFAEGGGGLQHTNRMPSLDLTSRFVNHRQQQEQEHGLPAGESTSQLPRPHGISSLNDGGLRLRHANSAPFDTTTNNLPTYSGTASSYYPEQSHAPMTPLDIQRMESEAGQRQYQLIPDQDYLRQRADVMSTVESNIVELGTIFNKLAVMVNEHRDLVQRVEDNVEDANANVNLSLATLTDTLRDLQTNRALGMKVMGILVLFIVMFIIFFA